MSYELNRKLAARRPPLPTSASVDAVTAAIIRGGMETICFEAATHLGRAASSAIINTSAASAMVCKPDAQKRFTVMPVTALGNPARIAAMRPMLRPCSPSGIAQPMMTSSTSSGFKPPAR